MSLLRWKGLTWDGWTWTRPVLGHVLSLEFRRRVVEGERDLRVTVGWTRS